MILRRGNRRGFTLMELVIMTAVGSFLLVGMSIAVRSQIKSSTDNRDYLVALSLAKRQMAIMNNSAYPAAAAEAALTADPDFPGFIVTQEVVGVLTNGSNSLREIRVRVRKSSVSGPVLVALHTYRSDILTFGDGL